MTFCPTEADVPPGTNAIRWHVDHRDYHRGCIAWWTCRLCEPITLRYGRGPQVAILAMEADVGRHLADCHLTPASGPLG